MTSTAPPAETGSASEAPVPGPSEGSSTAVPLERPAAGTVAVRLALSASIVLADLWSKAAVFGWLDRLQREGGLERDLHGHPRLRLADGWLTFMESRNPGAAFGQ